MSYGQRFVQLLTVTLLFVMSFESSDAVDWIDLRQAEIVAPDAGNIVNTAQRILTEEVAKRTGITFPP